MSDSAYALPPAARVGRVPLADGGEVAYEERGSGRALVFLHSSMGDRGMWRPTVARLADRYRCIALDLRGFGASSLPRERFSYFEDTLAVCAALGLERPVLVGSSLGGHAALDAAITAPSVPGGVVAIAAGAGGWTSSEEMRAFDVEMNAIAAEDGLEAAVDAELDFFVLRGRPRTVLDAEARAYLRETGLRTRERRWDYTLQQEIDTLARLNAISAPTSIILGALDVADFNAIGERLVAGIRGATALTLPAGHLVPIEAPGAVAAAIDELAQRAVGVR